MIRRLSLAAAVALLPVAAFAHTGHAGDHPFLSGLTHPIGGADHLLAMVALGLLAAQIGGRALWALPLAFVVASLSRKRVFITV